MISADIYLEVGKGADSQMFLVTAQSLHPGPKPKGPPPSGKVEFHVIGYGAEADPASSARLTLILPTGDTESGGTKSKIKGRRKTKRQGALVEEELVFRVDTAAFSAWIGARPPRGRIGVSAFALSPYQTDLLEDFAGAANLP